MYHICLFVRHKIACQHDQGHWSRSLSWNMPVTVAIYIDRSVRKSGTPKSIGRENMIDQFPIEMVICCGYTRFSDTPLYVFNCRWSIIVPYYILIYCIILYTHQCSKISILHPIIPLHHHFRWPNQSRNILSSYPSYIPINPFPLSYWTPCRNHGLIRAWHIFWSINMGCLIGGLVVRKWVLTPTIRAILIPYGDFLK